MNYSGYSLDDLLRILNESLTRELNWTPEQIAERERALADQRVQAARSLAIRGKRMARESIGKRFTVRSSNSLSHEGEIIECNVDGVRNRPKSVIVQFRVVMLCGKNRVRKEFVVEKLPR
jgi:hypothetical protein